MEFLYTYIETITTPTVSLFYSILGPKGVQFTISVLSWLYDIFNYIALINYRILGSIVDEFSTIGNLWVFIDNESKPLPYKVFNEHPCHVKWFYNKNVNSLYESINNISDRVSPSQLNYTDEILCRKLPWIMSVLSHYEVDPSDNEIIRQEYYLDDWVSTFFMTVYDNILIPPNILINCWSLNSGVWFSGNQKWRLQIINRDGDSVTFDNINSTFSDNDMLKWRKCLGLESIPTEENSDFMDNGSYSDVETNDSGATDTEVADSESTEQTPENSRDDVVL